MENSEVLSFVPFLPIFQTLDWRNYKTPREGYFICCDELDEESFLVYVGILESASDHQASLFWGR